MSAKVQPVIIIKRKKGGHAGHHGGAWKVAYADFVTAMMSLFIVLWLLSSSDQVKKAVGGYFTDPKGQGKDVGNGLKGAGSESISIRKDEMSHLKDKLALAVKDSPALQKLQEHVVFTMTSEGLRIEMLEGENATFFESGKANATKFGEDLLATLADEMSKLPNRLTIEGHTDSKPYGNRDYSNWELSVDRANAARRLMIKNGLQEEQVKEIRGYGDQAPREGTAPDDASNRRITVIIHYQQVTKKDVDEQLAKDGAPGPEADAKKKAEGEGKADGKAEAKADAKAESKPAEEAKASAPEPAKQDKPAGEGKPAAASNAKAAEKPSPLAAVLNLVKKKK